jgi:adenosylmethionine-8-amino-7-oxononanoate aminotransferase
MNVTDARYRFTAQATGPHIVRASGSILYTDTGGEIIDGASGALVTNVGHGRREVADAVHAAMMSVDYVIPVWTTPNRHALIDELVDHWLPDGFTHAFFAAGGSEANDSAIRLARMHHLATGQSQRWKVIGRDPSYHGSTLATLSAGQHRARRTGFEPYLSEWPKAPWNDANALAAVIEAAGPETVAAFIAEPVIGAAGGALTADADYWAGVAEVCRHHGVLMIADEVMTGFGRAGTRWGFEHDPWRPDIIVTGKGLGGGYQPISMVTAHNDVVDPITAAGQALMFFTYSGHDAGCAAALAVLGILEREQLVQRSARVGAQLAGLLHDRLDGHRLVTEIRGRGLFLGVGLRDVSSTAVVGETMKRNLWVYPAGSGGSTGDAVMIAPPLTVEEDLLPAIVDRLGSALDALAD